MAQTLTERTVVRIVQSSVQMDRRLPLWARRSNPVVRRELGLYWKTLPLETGLWLRMLSVQAVVVLCAVPLPILYSLIMPVVTVSIILVPITLGGYAVILYQIAAQAAGAVYGERRNHTLDLLRLTPQPLQHILFSKIAASIWRQLDNLSLVMVAHVLLSLPILVLQYASVYTLHEMPVLTALAIIAALFGYFARLFVEPAMVGALGTLMGALTAPRAAAASSAAALAALYFLAINLPRTLPLPLPLRVLVDLALPLALPLVIIAGALALTEWALRRD